MKNNNFRTSRGVRLTRSKEEPRPRSRVWIKQDEGKSDRWRWMPSASEKPWAAPVKPCLHCRGVSRIVDYLTAALYS